MGNFFVALFTCREKYRQTGSLDHRGTQVVRGDSVHWTQKAPSMERSRRQETGKGQAHSREATSHTLTLP